MTDDGSGNARDGPGRHEAIGTGVVAYVAGFALAHLAGRVVRTEPPLGTDGGPPAGTIAEGPEAAGTIFYSAHFYLASPWPGWYSVNALLNPGIALPESLVPRGAWFLLPAVLVTLSGCVLNERADAPATRARTAVRRGRRVTYGYLPLFFLGGIVFSRSIDLGLFALVVGLVYSDVLGGLGGYLSYRFGGRGDARSEARPTG